MHCYAYLGGFIAKSRCVVCIKPPNVRSRAETSMQKLFPTISRRFLNVERAWGRGHVQSSRGGPVPDTFSSSLRRFLWFPLLLWTGCQFGLCFALAGPVCFFSLKYFKPHLIFLDRQRGDSSVGFFPPSINKSSEKPTHYSVFSSGLYYLNLLGELEEHKHIFQWHQLRLGELWAPAIVPSCQHVAWCHRAGGGTRGDDSHSEAEQHLLLPPRCVWTQPSLFGSSNGSFKISFRGWNCWLRGSQSENCTDPKSLHFGAAGCKS